MNAKEYLSRAWRLEQQIQSKLEQVESLRSLACRVTSVWGSDPVSHTRNVTSMQDTVGKILEAEEELNRQIDELVAVKIEIAKVIDKVPDVILQLLLEKRYLSFKSWEQIAGDMKYTLRWLRTLHQEALDAVEEVLGNRKQ